MSKQTTTTKKDLKRANVLMRAYAQAKANKDAFMATIKNELDAYSKSMKDAEKELLEIGERNRSEFNAEGNLMLDDGYIHAATNTVVQTSRKFDAVAFEKAFPDMIDLSKALKVAPIKKAFLDADQRKELKAFGISTTTEENLQVLVNKDKE